MPVQCHDCRLAPHIPGLPFHIVELADFLPKDDIGGRQAWAEMRREQARVTETIINN